jgi:hypothetical protein
MKEKRCKDCFFGNMLEAADYCGKRFNLGGPCDYDYFLPKNRRNKNGDCEDYIKRRWWHRFWRASKWLK